MANRPTHISIPSANLDPISRPLYTPHDNIISPENAVPPALSPLDAFAMQSRMLAKKFEEESAGGRRLSRLPVNTVATEFAKSRPVFFRSVTTGSHGLKVPQSAPPHELSHPGLEVQTIHHAAPRPVSHYPQMILTDSVFGMGNKTFSFQSQLNKVDEAPVQSNLITRSESPDYIDSGLCASPPLPPPTLSPHNASPTKYTIVSQSPSRSTPNLVMAPTIRPVPSEATYERSMNGVEEALQTLSLERPNPAFQKESSVLRSPSLTSERSVSSSIHRPSFNFSRPISRASRPSMDSKVYIESPYPTPLGTSRLPLDVMYRQDSSDNHPSPFSNDAPQTPTSLASEDLFLSPEPRSESTPSSYTYSKYTLGKGPKRESVAITDFINRQFAWDDQSNDAQMTFSLPHPLVMSHSPPSPALNHLPIPGRRKDRPADIHIPGSLMIGRPSQGGSPAPRRKLQKSRPNTPTTIVSDTSTIKGVLGATAPKAATIHEVPPEEHLRLGIELHEDGALQKSTYHLRIAAKAGNPTAMLLYALACRHGWGMKANAEDAVLWLQQAVDSAQLEIAEDEDLIKSGHKLDVTERKSHKAQFALSVYELGVSYMRGWGVTQDRALGLRCFEIAGSWGDADALAEAGQCYMDGIGCKKDLKKAARFYRAAEEKGVQVAGNSW